jgi:zinc transporter ZupT
MIVQAAVIYFVTLAGGCVPLVFGIREHVQRSLIAAATGVLLAAVFLHILPALSQMQASVGARHAWTSLWMIVLAVVVGLGVVDAILCRREGHDDVHEHEEEHAHHHITAGWAALVGLSIHSFTEGLGLAAAFNNHDLASSMYSSIVAHKAAESFSLSTIFALAGLARKRIFLLQLVYACVTPLGVLSGSALTDTIGQYGLGVLTAITCGTFLFVGLCELLPGTFHRRDRAFFHLVLVALGVGFMLWFAED